MDGYGDVLHKFKFKTTDVTNYNLGAVLKAEQKAYHIYIKSFEYATNKNGILTTVNINKNLYRSSIIDLRIGK